MLKMKYRNIERQRVKWILPHNYLFHVVTQTEKGRYTLIKQSEHLT